MGSLLRARMSYVLNVAMARLRTLDDLTEQAAGKSTQGVVRSKGVVWTIFPHLA